MSIFSKIFGSRNQRVLNRLKRNIQKINALELKYKSMKDPSFPEKTLDLKKRYAQGETLDQLLPEAFAMVREASIRTLGLRHFDVQMIGGMILHQGKIAEMRTGEGKTLVATLAAYLNALTGKGVHIVTVNDYLAKRDAEWMGPIYRFLGLTVGAIVHDLNPAERKEVYACDVVYGTNNEFGFDYLRDNMAFVQEEKVQRELHYAIVDEVDSILIDEARTPLIISGPAEDSSALYVAINRLIPKLTEQKDEAHPGDFILDEKQRQAHLTENGHQKIEELLEEAGLLKEGDSLYAASNIILMHHINAALRAHTLFHRDVEYIVRNQEVVIVDEHTGRLMPGRRWSEGLHQAIEAKEGAKIQTENHTLATITFQNYFRLYEKLAGMTGTADTEAFEFQQIYGLEVIVIPTHMPMVRKDYPDLVYLKTNDKFVAIMEEIKKCRERHQPVLVGTASIENSEKLSALLNKENISHQVLNAKFHEQEAGIIANAGCPGHVTIATNMAGRGTDIVLGGNLEAELRGLPADTEDHEKERVRLAWQERHDLVVQAGGLHIIGSERHESRRIDNQLRGRSGRQGDPGSSRFYLSLEDNLIRIFASERLSSLMQRFGMEEGVALESKFLTRAIETAQKRVENFHFDIRKQLLEYDDVANEQRKVIYQQRNELMASSDISETIEAIREDVLNALIDEFIPTDSLEEQWNIQGLEEKLKEEFKLILPISEWLVADAELGEAQIREKIIQASERAYQEKEEQVSSEVMRQFEKSVMMQTLDMLWREHLSQMDYLRQGIHLRGYAQKNPKQEYKREAFNLFFALLDNIKSEVIHILSLVEVKAQNDVDAMEQERREALSGKKNYEHKEHLPLFGNEESLSESGELLSQPESHETYVRYEDKVGRNQQCPCGSGRKFKQCCGKITVT